jgi:hypothetical protein
LRLKELRHAEGWRLFDFLSKYLLLESLVLFFLEDYLPFHLYLWAWLFISSRRVAYGDESTTRDMDD